MPPHQSIAITHSVSVHKLALLEVKPGVKTNTVHFAWSLYVQVGADFKFQLYLNTKIRHEMEITASGHHKDSEGTNPHRRRRVALKGTHLRWRLVWVGDCPQSEISAGEGASPICSYPN